MIGFELFDSYYWNAHLKHVVQLNGCDIQKHKKTECLDGVWNFGHILDDDKEVHEWVGNLLS